MHQSACKGVTVIITYSSPDFNGLKSDTQKASLPKQSIEESKIQKLIENSNSQSRPHQKLISFQKITSNNPSPAIQTTSKQRNDQEKTLMATSNSTNTSDRSDSMKGSKSNPTEK